MAARLLSVLHLCDSLFPVGSFAYSDGLESATASGAVKDAAGLRAWVDLCLDEVIGRTEGPTLLCARAACGERDWDALVRLDREATALRPASATRAASRAMGLRLITTWHGLYQQSALEPVIALARSGSLGPAWPVAFACACAAAGIDQRSSIEAFAYNRLAASVSAAMRLMPIGHSDAHRVLAEALERVPPMVDAMLVRNARAESFAPAMDIAAMTQQYLHSRLFRS
jgi:urease accessory protein